MRNLSIASEPGNVSNAFIATASLRGMVGSISVPLSGSEGGSCRRTIEVTGLHTGRASEPGCYYNGERTAVIVYKNQEKTVEAYGQQDNWAKFDELTVDGRAAASAIDKSATQARICSTLFNAGGGSIIVDVSESRDQGLDECAESQKIAEAIAPRMPR